MRNSTIDAANIIATSLQAPQQSPSGSSSKAASETKRPKRRYRKGANVTAPTPTPARNPAEDGVLALTSEIVAAHVSRNTVGPDEIPNVIHQVYSALQMIHEREQAHKLPHTPAVSIDESVQPDYLVCLEDGRRLKMLKRHLRSAYGMSVEEYRRRWGLPLDYPMVAPNYAKHRSHLAKELGLGTIRRRTTG